MFKVMELFYYNCSGGYRAFYVCHDSEFYAQKYEVYLCELKESDWELPTNSNWYLLNTHYE